jgi:hypothetical protein
METLWPIDELDDPYAPNLVIEAYKAGIDQTLIAENLKLSHEERLLKLMQLQRFADELGRIAQERLREAR